MVTEFRSQEQTIANDTIAGSKIRSAAQYLHQNGPRIEQINHTADQIRLDVGSVNDTTAASLYDPLSEALSREADDLALFLNSVKDRSASAAQRAYNRLGADEERINNVALEQLPKVRAYANKLQG